MAEVSINPIPVANVVELKRSIQELAQTEPKVLDNAALQRCAGEIPPLSPDANARQAYDRMYHTHNRS